MSNLIDINCSGRNVVNKFKAVRDLPLSVFFKSIMLNAKQIIRV